MKVIISIILMLSPGVQAKDLCPAYDELEVNGLCYIDIEKITFCPGVIDGEYCVTVPEAEDQ